MRIFSRFVLFMVLQLLAPSALSDADGPDYWAVTEIVQGSHLNIRIGPSVKFSIIGTVPSDFKHLKNLACYPDFTITEWEQFNQYERKLAMEMRWCRVKYKDIIGWVNAKYLTEGMPPELN
jgi:uncharacterized protein YraI